MQTGKERDCLEGEDGGAIALALCPFPRILRPRRKELTHYLLLFPVTLHHFFAGPYEQPIFLLQKNDSLHLRLVACNSLRG